MLGSVKMNAQLELSLSEKPRERVGRGRGSSAGSLTVDGVLFPHTICQREMKASLKPSNESENEGETSAKLSCCVVFCFRCLHMLPELVNHIGSLGYHNILTK